MKKEDVAYIYSLIDPIDNSIRYIGWTSNVENRYKQHLKEARRGSKNHRCNWIRSLFSKNVLPTISVIEEIPYSKRQEREVYWISYYGRENLVNSTDGGEGQKGAVVSDSVKRYFSELFSGEGNPFFGKTHTNETKLKLRNRIVSDDTKEKIRKWHEGKKLSEDHKNKISESLKSNPPFLGKKHTEEAKEKNRIWHLGKPAWNKGKRTNIPSSNRGIKTSGNSEYIGVSIKANGFSARVHVNGERLYLYGTKNEKFTAIAYDIGAIFYYGEDSSLNFPELREEYIQYLSQYEILDVKELRKIIKSFLEERSQ